MLEERIEQYIQSQSIQLGMGDMLYEHSPRHEPLLHSTFPHPATWEDLQRLVAVGTSRQVCVSALSLCTEAAIAARRLHAHSSGGFGPTPCLGS